MREINQIDKGIKQHSTKLKYCPNCSNVWEKFYKSSFLKSTIRHYDDFPSIGLERKLCIDCLTKIGKN